MRERILQKVGGNHLFFFRDDDDDDGDGYRFLYPDDGLRCCGWRLDRMLICNRSKNIPSFCSLCRNLNYESKK